MQQKQQHTIVLGAQWGDEGKGKVVDVLSTAADAVCRFQGGHNAGHTLVINGETLVLHLVPSGILHDSIECLIGSGTVIGLESLANELDALQKIGINYKTRLLVSLDAHVILPYHSRLDQLREKQAGDKDAIGTTGRGIGPTYEDKVARRGIRLCDLLTNSNLETVIAPRLALYNRWFVDIFNADPMTIESVLEPIQDALKTIAPLVGDVRSRLFDLANAGKSIVFEGAQGALLDIAHGTYPFVTSSHTTVGGAFTGTGFGGLLNNARTIGIAKAYVTRVGNGAFPTELHDDIGARLAKRGHEFGSTTGRPRRCGWLDLVALRSVVRSNNISSLCLTKLDVLDGLETINVCIAYRLPDGSRHETVPEGLDWSSVTPEYQTCVGWRDSSHGATKWNELPSAARDYIAFLEDALGVTIGFISTGADRTHTIIR